MPSIDEENRKLYDIIIERQADGSYILIGDGREIPLGNEAELDKLKDNAEKQIDLLLSV